MFTTVSCYKLRESGMTVCSLKEYSLHFKRALFVFKESKCYLPPFINDVICRTNKQTLEKILIQWEAETKKKNW